MRIYSFAALCGIAFMSATGIVLYQHYNNDATTTATSDENEEPLLALNRPLDGQTKTIEPIQVVSSISLIAKPTTAADYFQNGNYYLEQKETDKAMAAFKEAEKLKYDKKAALYYQMAAAQSQYLATTNENADNYWTIEQEAGDYLTKAHENGFEDYTLLLTDAKMKTFRDLYSFVGVFKDMFSENKTAMFACLVERCPNKGTALPYAIGKEAVFANLNYDQKEASNFYKTNPNISGYFDDFVPGAGSAMFSRGGGDDYNYETILKTNPSIIALIYSTESTWTDGVFPKTYHLATFTPQGEPIANIELASRTETNCKTAQISTDGTIVIQEYDVAWARKIESSENLTIADISKFKMKGKAKIFNLAENGDIKPSKLAIGMLQ